jgi:hypothetical protein
LRYRRQALGRHVQAEADYFWKFTRNAFDFGVLSFGSFNTPIEFPISWDKSKLDGVSFRVSTVNISGFQWYTTIGHNRARYFPSNGSVFRIDHDQALQELQTFATNGKLTARGVHSHGVTIADLSRAMSRPCRMYLG